MNAARTASLCRQIGSLFIELADALTEPEQKKRRQRPLVPPVAGRPASPEVVERVRRRLRRQGVVA